MLCPDASGLNRHVQPTTLESTESFDAYTPPKVMADGQDAPARRPVGVRVHLQNEDRRRSQRALHAARMPRRRRRDSAFASRGDAAQANVNSKA